MAKLVKGKLVPEAAPQCKRNLAHIPAYEDTPMRCTLPHSHEGPHVYRSKKRDR